MSRKRVPVFALIQTLPTPLRVALAAGLTLVALVAGLLPGTLSTSQLQLLLLATVLFGAWTAGVAAGLVGATLGFGLMLWRAVDTTAGGGWALSFEAAVDGFFWFALAKLTAALVSTPQGLVTQLLERGRQAEAVARRRELLLAEMSHRTSNDLALLVTMLQMQAAADPEAAEALGVAADRVSVFGQIHRRLSRDAEPGARVDSRLFLEGLVADLRAGLDGVRPVLLTVTAEAHVLLPARAGDIGLVVNELVTNALKHAFPNGREGVVRVTFRREEDAFVLVVSDNGVGSAPEGAARGGGIGRQILQALAVQLGGRLDVVSGEVGGTQCRLGFPVPHLGETEAAMDATAMGKTMEQQPQASRSRRRHRR